MAALQIDILSIDVLALAFFLVCLLLSIYFRERARRLDIVTGKKIRSHYRHDFIVNIVHQGNITLLIETIRNNIMISGAMITALVISFGFIVNANTNIQFIDGNLAVTLRTVLTIALLVYAFFMILLEARTLIYVPIIFGTSDKLIVKHEGTSRTDYLARLLHESFDHFSNAIRALIFIVALLVWSYNVYVFIAFTAIVTYLMVREDFGGRSDITIF